MYKKILVILALLWGVSSLVFAGPGNGKNRQDDNLGPLFNKGGMFPISLAFGPKEKLIKSAYGYIGVDFKWYNVSANTDAQGFERFIPRPLAIYEQGELRAENLRDVSARDRDLIRMYFVEPDYAKFLSIKRQNGEYRYFYKINQIELEVPRGKKVLDRFSLKEAILGANQNSYPQYFPRFQKFIQKLQTWVGTTGYNNNLRRETINSRDVDFSLERFKYYMIHMAQEFYAEHLKTDYHLKNPSRKVSCPDASRSAYQFSIVPFRAGNLDQTCKQQVDRGVASGFTKVTLFYPIPYAGGDAETYGDKAPKKLAHGWDYIYPNVGTIKQEELNRCLTYIYKAGLELNFVPHLESIVTLNTTKVEKEWRIMANIPLDARYYRRAFTPLVNFLKANQELTADKKIRVSVAAEIDPIFMGNTNDSLLTTNRLRRELQSTGVVPEVTWNPNGGFLHGFTPLATRHLECKKLVTLLSSVDRISPSMYEQYNHIVAGSYKKSKALFFKSLLIKLKQMCPRQIKAFRKVLKNKKFSIGEFALSRSNYHSFHQQLAQERKRSGDDGLDATFWNAGEWDHANTTGTMQGSDAGIDKSLKACRAPASTVPRAGCYKSNRGSDVPPAGNFKILKKILSYLDRQ